MTDYTDDGFDGFLSRSIDNISQRNLDAPGPQSTAIRYDSSQVTGILGDTFRPGNTSQEGIIEGEITIKGKLFIGNITIDGENDKITMKDNDQKEFLSFQKFPDGRQGFIIVKTGFSVPDVLS